MKSTDQLFNLVKTLSKSEKGYLRKFSGLHSDQKTSKYMLLFDAIDNQNEYDEAKIKRKFRNERFVKQFPVAKNYLYNLILKCLTSYQQNIDAELFQLYRESQILYDRGLELDAMKLVLKMREKALEHERMPLLLMALRHEMNIYIRLRDEYADDRIADYIAATKDALSLHLNQAEYHWNYNRIFNFCQKVGSVRNKEQVTTIFSVVNEQKQLTEQNAKSKHALRDFYKTHEMINSTIGNSADMYMYSKKHCEVIDTNKEIFNFNFHYTAVSLFNLANSCMALGKFDEGLKYVAEIEKLKPLSKSQEAIKLTHTAQPKISIYLAQKKYHKCAVVIGKMTDNYIRLQKHISPLMKVILPFEIAYVEFLMGDYHQALRWANMVINERQLALRTDLHDKMNVFELLIHYELGNTMIMEYRIKSAKKRLEKKNSLHETEQAVIKYLRLLIKADEDEKRKIYTDFLTALNSIFKQNKLEAVFLDYVNIVAWLQSKIENRPMAQVMASGKKL
jgi:hypothetical protein